MPIIVKNAWQQKSWWATMAQYRTVSLTIWVWLLNLHVNWQLHTWFIHFDVLNPFLIPSLPDLASWPHIWPFSLLCIDLDSRKTFFKMQNQNKKNEFEIEMRIVEITTSFSFIIHKISQMFPGSKYDANNLTQVWFKSGPSLVQVLY